MLLIKLIRNLGAMSPHAIFIETVSETSPPPVEVP
jgi:hypothetical protein